MENVFLLFGFLVVIVLIRVWLHHMDVDAIKSSAANRGFKNVTVVWAPFAPGACFEKNERHYRARGKEKDGRIFERYCNASLFGGVYWKE